MQSYSVVAVGDTAASCYDFCIERTSEKEGLDESKTFDGGLSHE